jgi:hypothetical protein
VEKSEFKTAKESDPAKEKCLPVEPQSEGTADNPRIGQNLFHQEKGTGGKVRIGMQEKQDFTGRLPCPRIHLDGTALLAADHPGLVPCHFPRPIHTAAVNDKEFSLPRLVFDAAEAREDIFGFIQRRNNNRNFHQSAKGKPCSWVVMGTLSDESSRCKKISKRTGGGFPNLPLTENDTCPLAVC